MQFLADGFTSPHPGNDAVCAAGNAAEQSLEAFAFEISDGHWLLVIEGSVTGFRKAEA